MGMREAVGVDVEERMSGRFVSVDRDTAYLLPPSVQDWLPENHLARFVVEIVERIDLGKLTTVYRGRGSDAQTGLARVVQHPRNSCGAGAEHLLPPIFAISRARRSGISTPIGAALHPLVAIRTRWPRVKCLGR